MTESEARLDAELVLKFQAGQEGAFGDLVRRHMKDAYSFALRLCGDPQEAEEVSQEGFVQAYRALGSFRGESAFRSWLFRILINLHRDRHRRRRREETRLAVVREEEERKRAPEEGQDLRAAELAEAVKNRLQVLPDRQREVLVLHVYRGMDYREISAVLGCSYEDVKMNLSLARKRLRAELKEYL